MPEKLVFYVVGAKILPGFLNECFGTCYELTERFDEILCWISYSVMLLLDACGMAALIVSFQTGEIYPPLIVGYCVTTLAGSIFFLIAILIACNAIAVIFVKFMEACVGTVELVNYCAGRLFDRIRSCFKIDTTGTERRNQAPPSDPIPNPINSAAVEMKDGVVNIEPPKATIKALPV